jgi:chromosome segregation protein
MLQRLDLIGFKSFVEKTTFEFSPGITAIVGPNGSGKSNIVDAIRWVLGEQSVKSLRGQDMSDVIFNGSATRRSLGMAEVVMHFDNSRKALATEAGEVQISRRIYRDGQSDYLINGEIRRLKDIRDLFLGSGAGVDAYCVIEQGRIEVLLQASTKDRRAIFEEAAGISRFKAKKVESLRKLERVSLNLDRVRDIVEELDKQLRSVQLQAAKAQRYQEYHARLKELRIGLGLQEFYHLDRQLSDESTALDNSRILLQDQAAIAQDQEKEVTAAEDFLNRADEDLHDQETLLTQIRQRLATEELTLEHERESSAELESDLAETRLRQAELCNRVQCLMETVSRADHELASEEALCLERSTEVERQEKNLAHSQKQLKDLQDQIQEDKAGHFEQLRQAARWHNDAISSKAQFDTLFRERDRLRQRTEQVTGHLASLDLELEGLTAAEEGLQIRLTHARQTQNDTHAQSDQLQKELQCQANSVSDLKSHRSGLASRIEVLQDLERSQEGLGAGPREMADWLNGHPELRHIVAGMVADLLTVERENAATIDLALGETAQSFLVRDFAQLDALLATKRKPFSSRISFLPLKEKDESEGLHTSDTADVSLSMRCVAEMVRCENPEFANLPNQLLGRTLLVKDLLTARQLALQHPGCRFLTTQNELLEANGTLSVGTHHAEASILSRKAELRDLHGRVESLESQINQAERLIAASREAIAALDATEKRQKVEIEVLAEQVNDMRLRIGQHRQQRAGLHEEASVGQSELVGLEVEIQVQEKAWKQAQAKAEAAEELVAALESRLSGTEIVLRENEGLQQQLQESLTAAKVALAQAQERMTSLSNRHQQMAADLEERRLEGLKVEEHKKSTIDRQAANQMAILTAEAHLALWYVEKETLEVDLKHLMANRDDLRQRKQTLAEQTQKTRQVWEAKRDEVHQLELKVNDLKHKCDGLCGRMREEYQVEFAEVYREIKKAGHWGAEATSVQPESPPSGQENGPVSSFTSPFWLPASKEDSVSAHSEIEDLRRKLTRLGNVNLEALQELKDLEMRAASLKGQADDLTSAQRSLEEIIGKINDDSRKLFTDTFEAIRTHFQELFRKLFGGGMADIVLEDVSDVLESGIEIVARPPGKEMRNLSLMSGGEKTLTAVALLLAIFRSKPSPFCILDEVDAPLDEANIGRFTSVLREFLDRSQFILITHSKRTMASADVLYGITMQESGVSKRVSVRFEDWPEDGSGLEAQRVSA